MCICIWSARMCTFEYGVHCNCLQVRSATHRNGVAFRKASTDAAHMMNIVLECSTVDLHKHTTGLCGLLQHGKVYVYM